MRVEMETRELGAALIAGRMFLQCSYHLEALIAEIAATRRLVALGRSRSAERAVGRESRATRHDILTRRTSRARNAL